MKNKLTLTKKSFIRGRDIMMLTEQQKSLVVLDSRPFLGQLEERTRIGDIEAEKALNEIMSNAEWVRFPLPTL